MTTEKKSWLYEQLFTGWKKFEIGYIGALLALQVVVYLIAPDSIVGMVSGLAGVICLVYGMKGRKITFIFGLVQSFAMAYIGYKSHAYGAFIIGIVYVISQPIGWFLWGNDDAVNSFSAGVKKKLFAGAFIAWGIGWLVLAKLGGQLPYIDSVNLVISLIAQTLYIFKYKENWSLWILVNIANLFYWSLLSYQIFNGISDFGTLGGALSQVALQFALLFNSIYANKVWNDYDDAGEK